MLDRKTQYEFYIPNHLQAVADALCKPTFVFFVLHKVDNVVIFILLKSGNKLDIVFYGI